MRQRACAASAPVASTPTKYARAVPPPMRNPSPRRASAKAAAPRATARSRWAVSRSAIGGAPGDHLAQALADGKGGEDAAVEEQRIRARQRHPLADGLRDLGGVVAQEGGGVAGDGRVGLVGEPELEEARAPAPLRAIAGGDAGKEPVQEDGQDLLAPELRGERAADEPAPAPGDGDPRLIQGSTGRQEPLLGFPAGLHE